MEIDQEGPVGSPGTGRAPGATTDVEMEGAPETGNQGTGLLPEVQSRSLFIFDLFAEAEAKKWRSLQH